MRPKLVFIDDDPQELKDFRLIVGEEYEYLPIEWPTSKSLEDMIKSPPAIFVLDMYFPGREKPQPEQIPSDKIQEQSELAKGIGERFKSLYQTSDQTLVSGKDLLRETFSCIQAGYDLLWKQCSALGQSAENGRDLLEQLKSNPLYKRVPIVFYSRKATVSETVRALQAGAQAVIPKPDSPPDLQARESVLSQLKSIQDIYRNRWKMALTRFLKLNINVTLFKYEFSANKSEATIFKIGW